MRDGVGLLVVAALRGEVAPLVGRLAQRTAAQRMGSARLVRGRLHEAAVAVAWTGDGQRCAREGLVALLDALPTERLLVIGVAGGLSPALPAAAVVAAERVIDDEQDVPPPRTDWVDGLGAASGTMLSVSRIAVSRADKAALWQRLGRPAVATVDLETAVFARVATDRDVPYAVLRAVSDTANETLPVDFNLLRDARGRVNQASVARWALRHPAAMPKLIRLGQRLRVAGRQLADLAEAFWAREAATCRG